MWLNEYKDVLLQDIDRFEQEMVVAIHWIPAKIWEECIDELLASVPEAIQPIMFGKMQSLVELLQELFNSTVSTDIAQAFAAFLVSGNIDAERRLTLQISMLIVQKYMVCLIRIKTCRLLNFH